MKTLKIVLFSLIGFPMFAFLLLFTLDFKGVQSLYHDMIEYYA